MSKPSQVIVLLEDERTQRLVRRYLIRRNFNPRQITFRRSPAGSGSAENWVRRRFAIEVSAYRSRQTRANTALIVVIDADAHSVQHRMYQLDEELHSSGKPRVDSEEQIARLVPKRNIETWILCLNGQAVEEQTDYKQHQVDWGALISPAAETLIQWSRRDAELPAHCVTSLRCGVAELGRLNFN